MTAPRWQTPEGISDLSVAVDEIYFLRAILADEALILQAHLEYKTFPQRRRRIAEGQVDRMRLAARGRYDQAADERALIPQVALRHAGASPTLTNHAWAAQRGLVLVETRREG